MVCQTKLCFFFTRLASAWEFIEQNKLADIDNREAQRGICLCPHILHSNNVHQTLFSYYYFILPNYWRRQQQKNSKTPLLIRQRPERAFLCSQEMGQACMTTKTCSFSAELLLQHIFLFESMLHQRLCWHFYSGLVPSAAISRPRLRKDLRYSNNDDYRHGVTWSADSTNINSAVYKGRGERQQRSSDSKWQVCARPGQHPKLIKSHSRFLNATEIPQHWVTEKPPYNTILSGFTLDLVQVLISMICWWNSTQRCSLKENL